MFKSNGYMLVKCSNHPRADKRGWVKRYWLIVEKKLGRYISSNEIVHHINGIKDDDRIKNLQVMSQAEHMRLHKTGMRHTKKSLKKMSKTWFKKGHKPPKTAFRKGHKAWATGRRFTEEHRRNLSISHKGKIPWNKGKKCLFNIVKNFL